MSPRSEKRTLVAFIATATFAWGWLWLWGGGLTWLVAAWSVAELPAYAQTRADPQGVSLRDYMERILQERDAAHTAELAAAEKTLLAANEALTARLEKMNEFRLQIQEERVSYVRQDQYNAIAARVALLENRAANLDGRFWALGVGLTIFTVLLNLATRFVGKKLGGGSA